MFFLLLYGYCGSVSCICVIAPNFLIQLLIKKREYNQKYLLSFYVLSM